MNKYDNKITQWLFESPANNFNLTLSELTALNDHLKGIDLDSLEIEMPQASVSTKRLLNALKGDFGRSVKFKAFEYLMATCPNVAQYWD